MVFPFSPYSFHSTSQTPAQGVLEMKNIKSNSRLRCGCNDASKSIAHGNEYISKETKHGRAHSIYHRIWYMSFLGLLFYCNPSTHSDDIMSQLLRNYEAFTCFSSFQSDDFTWLSFFLYIFAFIGCDCLITTKPTSFCTQYDSYTY